jgi:hypothetical protein
MKNAMRFVGLAILTAVAPIAVLIASSPAHADVVIREGQGCKCEGTLTTDSSGGRKLICKEGRWSSFGAYGCWGESCPAGCDPHTENCGC